MSRRIERINNLIRNTIGELLLTKISDPRVDSARVSVTRVETADDLLSAKVFISVMGDEAQQRNTLRALRHSAGRIQELMMRQIQLRNTPVLSFEPDVRFKQTLQTLQLISQAMEEIRQKEEARGQQADEGTEKGEEPADQSDRQDQQEQGDEEA